MVNLFITHFDYTTSAKNLDNKRLGKQRVEALQILNLIQDLKFLSQRYNKPRPINPYDFRAWVRTLASLYKKEPIRLYRGDHCITLGFVYHPAILMFLGYEDSLKRYINAHIQEWISRGFENTMQTYKTYKEDQPIFTLDPTFHRNHKAALLTKEIERNEPKWYIKKKDFVEAYEYYQNYTGKANKTQSEFKYYIWPFNQKDECYVVKEIDGKLCIGFKN